MLDEVIGWIAALLPWRVWLALMIAFVVLAGLLVLWATWH